ncbi:unnamed protein product [Vitrella brassicaformis CCMP3155]|uniref:Carboxylesterase type B domain-containing protein n=1 Tax=Vitrella brassicaformis (strain CCMP3155) TaxID=1169540 RepID=A0A0G4E9U5_VITBC|nr:unnamed protein product [Vitrella brassicaformis CCMP3155]|eukprot:CEL92209.1 unnamed protein product [Vitrella brassicaformis CCMP3155]
MVCVPRGGVCVWLLLAVFASCGEAVVIELPDGTEIRGIDQADTDTEAFLGIQFGDAPRFEKPTLIPLGGGHIDATNKGPACPSACKQVVGSPQFCLSESGLLAEQCLYLHVWVPKGVRERGEKRNVLALIHGGGWDGGTSGAAFTDGAALAQRTGLVVVGLNYRLGIFGGIVTDYLPRNLGFLDQRVALEWIQKYIHHFGGSRDVTLVGFSAGAVSAACHLASESAGRLFKKVIAVSQDCCQSGRSLELATAQSNFALTALTPSCGPVHKAERDLDAYIECIKTAPVKDLLAANLLGNMYLILEDFFILAPWRLVEDGEVLSNNCYDPLVTGEYNTDVPLMLSSTPHEGTVIIRQAINFFARDFADMLTQVVFNPVTWMATIKGLFGARADEFLELYPLDGVGEPATIGLTPDRPDTASSFSSAFGHSEFSCSTRQLCANVTGTCYLASYESGWSYTESEKFTAKSAPGSYFHSLNRFCGTDEIRCHLEDQPWLLQSARRMPEGFAFTSAEEEAVKTVHQYWRNFANTGVPDGAGDGDSAAGSSLPPWPPYTRDERLYMKLSILSDDAPAGRALSEAGYMNDECGFWDSIIPKYDVSWKGYADRTRQARYGESEGGECGSLQCPSGSVCVTTANVDMPSLGGGSWEEWLADDPIHAARALSLFSSVVPRYSCVSASSMHVVAQSDPTDLTWAAMGYNMTLVSSPTDEGQEFLQRAISEAMQHYRPTVRIGEMEVDLRDQVMATRGGGASLRVLGNLAAVASRKVAVAESFIDGL